MLKQIAELSQNQSEHMDWNHYFMSIEIVSYQKIQAKRLVVVLLTILLKKSLVLDIMDFREDVMIVNFLEQKKETG